MDNKSEFALGRKNYKLLGISIAIIIVGYLLLYGGASNNPNEFNEDEIFSFRRITLAPLVLLFGYFFAIYAIMVKDKK